MDTAGLAEQVAPRLGVGRPRPQQQPVDAVQPALRVELLAAGAAALQQLGVARRPVFDQPRLDDAPRVADAAAVENQLMFVPQVANHGRPPQQGGAARAAHAQLVLQLDAEGVDGLRGAVQALEVAQPLHRLRPGEPADQLVQHLRRQRTVRAGRAHQGAGGGELRLHGEPSVEQQGPQRRQHRRVERRRLLRDQGRRQPAARDLVGRGQGGRQRGVRGAGDQVGQPVHGLVPPGGVHARQQGADQRGQDRGGAGAVFVAHEGRQHGPRLGVRRRLGQEVEQQGEGFGVGAAGAAEDVLAVGGAEVGFVGGGGDRGAALRADDLLVGRRRAGQALRIVLVAVWHGGAGVAAGARR